MNKKFNEGEVQSLTCDFLRRNHFHIATRTQGGQALQYRVLQSKRPQFKRPDQVGIKDDYVMVFEEKTRYADLFRPKGKSDVEKLSMFIGNPQAVEEFKELVKGTQLTSSPKIIGGLASLRPSVLNPPIPDHFVYIAVLPNPKRCTVELIQCDARIRRLFRINSCELEI